LAAALDGIQFNAALVEKPPKRLRAAYQLELDEWQGTLRLQLLLRHVEAV